MSKGAETRGVILDEAMQLASSDGLEGLSIGRLAERLEMSKSGLFAHFRSKEQLQLQTLARTRERFTDLVVRPTLSAPRGEPRLRAVFEHWLRWAQTGLRGGCLFVAASVELDDRPGPVRDALARDQRDWLELLATVAGTAVAEGHLREDVDPHQVAHELQGIFLAHHHASRLLRDAHAEQRTRTAFESLLAAHRRA